MKNKTEEPLFKVKKKKKPKPPDYYLKKRRERYFKSKIPEASKVLEATKLEGSIAPVIKQIIILRIMKGITSSEMATSCSVSIITYRKIERGESLPTLALLLRMAFVVNARIELTGWMDNKD